MRRASSSLVVDTTPATLNYELNVSPRTSLDSQLSEVKLSSPVSPPPPPPPPSTTITPSIKLLFSLLSPRNRLTLLLPAVITSMIAGGIAPFMTFVVGQAFDAFAKFPLTSPSEQDKDNLLRGVGIAALELVGLAVGSIALGSVTSSLWIWTGEVNVASLRRRVYRGVMGRDMEWFDTHLGGNDDAEGPLGAAGLMAKFNRETDEVRAATSIASGNLLQYLTTTITCLVLAFTRSWSLTLIILSAVPLLTFLQGVSQSLASPLLASERTYTGVAATLLSRAATAIATVKSFNAQPHESRLASSSFLSLDTAARKLNLVWAATSGSAQFVMMAMFVQGFWFGAKLVRDGKASAGDVMAVFWACLIATSNLQMCVPQFITVAKGKFAMVELLSLLPDENTTPPAPRPTSVNDPITPRTTTTSTFSFTISKPRALRKIHPKKFTGELALHAVTFSYPSRPDTRVLEDVSLFLPAGELTFIVGASGSGKSTIAQLLLGMYAPQEGSVCLDEQDVRYLDESFLRSHVGGVGGTTGGGVVLDGKSLYENVLLGLSGSGRSPESMRNEEVEDACRAALVHEFVRDLPQGYETVLGGSGGVSLSGGQRQRLEIARARLWNPDVLVLDEATSALDATSRILVFEAIKHWRRGKTTIVITHDLSQIDKGDFVYVMKSGRVVEQGYRGDLETASSSSSLASTSSLNVNKDEGEFRKMLASQQRTGGFVPREVGEEVLIDWDEESEDDSDEEETVPSRLKHQSIAIRPLTLGNWMFDVVADLTAIKPEANISEKPEKKKRETYRVSRWVPPQPEIREHRPRRPSSIQVLDLPIPQEARTVPGRRLSLQFTPTSPTFSLKRFEEEQDTLERNGVDASRARRDRTVVRQRWDQEKVEIRVEKPLTVEQQEEEEDNELPPPFWTLNRAIFPNVPYKPLLFFGLVICLLSGAMTPVFSFVLSRLLFEVSTGAKDYFIMETCAMAWVTKVRVESWGKILKQDKKWFDSPRNAPSRLVQVLVKDGDDARNLIAVVWGQCLVVIAMLGVGLIWALVQGWQLTLVGFAIAPVFAGTMALQTRLVAKCEIRNKRAREEVARGYFDAISNVRGIRAMAFDSVFEARFDAAAEKALSTGVRGALLFYVGAVLIAKGTYTYLQMVEVLNLVVFSVTIGSQLMAFTEKIAKSIQATNDLNKLLELSTDNVDESKGFMRPELVGPISFKDVRFAYPERPEAQVLRSINLNIQEGECVAIVGSSGSGKSTVAALLQRLYEPDSGSISIGPYRLSSTDVRHLREHISVVSQQPNLFDASVAENIRYGNMSVSEIDIRIAAKAANVHEFIMSLPQGYDTPLGENASLISGGQAQRLQIARALARPSRILVLDECTSSLDPENQAAVMETIRQAKVGRTTLMITHKLQVMLMCDRIIVVHDGEVAEQGTYEELMHRKGVFASLANGGEWIGD
ncbi:P-loop containing nucleoside triphosphate hydrolase protein [Cyathus striatus]|nr:P-loop containing nucleoside triphosphate hydrolase protein [Cyathus striatus]